MEAAKFLLANGADPNIKDVFGQKPLDHARSHKQYWGGGKELGEKLNELIAQLEKVTVDLPQRRIFGQMKLPDGTLVNGTVTLTDAESFANLGRMETRKDSWFEFHLTEGQQFRISAYFKIEKDGQEVFFYVRHEVQIRILTVKGDVGPINITLDSILRRKKSDK